MKYVDLHCDTLTVCADRGLSLSLDNLQTGAGKLKKGGCGAQCFAIFTEGEPAAAAQKVRRYLTFYGSEILPRFNAVKTYADLKACFDGGRPGAILTVENLGFINGDVAALDALYKAGVRMASLVWNNSNALARPNLIFKDGLPDFSAREKRGLTALGREAVERLDGLGIIVDVSHLSDGGTEEILSMRKIPTVASHSNAEAACGVSRNLTDGLIKKIADCGGVIGVNFCKDFLGGSGFEIVLKHIKHMISVGGEDCVSFGSDFDGIPQNADIPDCASMPDLLNYLNGYLSADAVEKLAYKNFARVFKTVCG